MVKGADRMKPARLKAWSLIVGVTLPGFFAWSCSGTAMRKFRDATLEGAASAVQGRVFDFVADALAPQTDDQVEDEGG